MPEISGTSLGGFLACVAFTSACAVAAVRVAWDGSARATGAAVLAVAVWLWVTFGVAAAGWLRDFSSLPPPFVVFFAACTVLAAGLVFSPVGTRVVAAVPVAWLVGFQAFRIPVEWFLHRVYTEGVVPVQMTYEGLNFDIVSGATALGVAVVCARSSRPPRTLVLVWSILGLALLANIVTVAVLSAPTPFRRFANEPANTFVAYPPWVWLPTVLVQAAWVGHLLAFRWWARGTLVRR